ncbi:g7327 [Coccomyxa elongata]
MTFLWELRDELQKRNLDTSGLKAALVERLEGAVKTETPEGPAAKPALTVNANLTLGSSLQPSPFRLVLLGLECLSTTQKTLRFGIVGDAAAEKRKASKPICSQKAASEEELAALLEKKKARAARFNVPLMTTGDEEQLQVKSRAERFKDQLSNAPLAKAAINSKPSTAAAAEFEAKKKARAERFKVAL